MTHLYSCKDAGDQWRITKFDDDMNVESSYLCTEQECECPAGVRPSCRHRQMLPKFIRRGFVNSNHLYDFDRDGWVQSDFGEALRDSVDLTTAGSATAGVSAADVTYSPLPPGVFVIGLDDPQVLHDAIADAVGEPQAKLNPLRRGL